MALELYAPTLYKALNGVFCIYKPAGQNVHQLIHALKTNLTRELNRLPGRPARQRVLIGSSTDSGTHDSCHDSSGSSGSSSMLVTGGHGTNLPVITTAVDLADHPLVVGPRYIKDDFYISSTDDLSYFGSGVQVMSIGRGISRLRLINQARYLRAYHVKGQLGLATQDFTVNGKLVEKTTFKHVSRDRLDRVTAAIQAGHQKYMFTAAGVDLQSQEAYELACRGLLRPVASVDNSTVGPLLYGIRCIQFKPPDFTLEIHCVNESSVYLMKLIHEIGLEMRTTAACSALRRLRYGHFSVAHALLPKHCDAHNITKNIDFCRPLVAWDKLNERVDVISMKEETDSTEQKEALSRLYMEDLDSFGEINDADELPTTG